MAVDNFYLKLIFPFQTRNRHLVHQNEFRYLASFESVNGSSLFFMLVFRFRIVLAHFVILFAGIKLVLYRFLIIILLHDNMLLFPLSTNTTIREPLFFEKLEKQKTRSFIYVSSIFSEQLQRKEIHIIQNKKYSNFFI